MALPTESSNFSDALVILGAAGLVIPAFARLRINPVIGFILVGIAVGPAGLGRFVPQLPWLYHVTLTHPHAIEPFAELGVILLLFSIGLELSFQRLWSMRGAVFGLGTAELAGFRMDLREPRRRTLLHVVGDLFPDGGDRSQACFWTGLRPMTPDGTPVLGPTPIGNLWLSTGHGTLGWTMAAGSGRLLADWMSGRAPEIDTEGLALSRYGRPAD